MKMWVARSVAALMLGIALWFGASAEAQGVSPAPLLRLAQVTVAEDGSMQALVSVADASGKAIRGLSSANFRVAVDGEPMALVTVATAQSKSAPLSIVLAIDISASMRGEGLRAAVRGASAFVDRLGPHDKCSLIVFGTGVREITGFTEDREQIKHALESLRATDTKTYLYQALFDALDRAAAVPTARVAVVGLTDGKDDGSPLGLQEVVAKAAARDVPIYTLAYGANTDTGTLRRISAASRGVFYTAPRPEDVPRAYADIVDQLQSDYLLSWRSPERSKTTLPVVVSLEYRGQTASASVSVSPARLAPVNTRPENAPPGRALWIWILGMLGIAVAAGGWGYVRYRHRQDPGLAATMVPPRVWFEVVKGADTGQKLLLLGAEAIIGRDPRKSQIVLKSDPLVGRQHARLRQDAQGRYVLEDMGSQNGVWINGVRIADPVTLQTDDRIVVGLSELLFIDHR